MESKFSTLMEDLAEFIDEQNQISIRMMKIRMERWLKQQPTESWEPKRTHLKEDEYNYIKILDTQNEIEKIVILLGGDNE